MAQIPLGSTRLDSTRLDTFDFVEPVEPVELVVSSESSCAVRLARHSQNAWARHVECVESSRVESSQVEFEPMWSAICAAECTRTVGRYRLF